MWKFYLWNSLGVNPVSNEEETSCASLRWRCKNLWERNKTKETNTAAALRGICLRHSEENNPVSRSALCCTLWAAVLRRRDCLQVKLRHRWMGCSYCESAGCAAACQSAAQAQTMQMRLNCKRSKNCAVSTWLPLHPKQNFPKTAFMNHLQNFLLFVIFIITLNGVLIKGNEWVWFHCR